MHKLLLISLSLLMACTQQTKTPEVTEVMNERKNFPESLQKIFSKHGSLELWQQMKSLSYEIVGEESNEKQMIHLQDRRERIEAANYKTGFDGTNIWLEADTTYSGNPVFYHNLMFYFYAMPFVLADDGINYSIADTLTFEGRAYPGIRIAYEAEVGSSPEDEYFLHYNPETYQMTWLGYTVTYFSKEKSKEIKWIRYDDWKDYNGLILPKSMTWYNYIDGQLIDPRGSAEFENVLISTTAWPDSIFQKTVVATIVE